VPKRKSKVLAVSLALVSGPLGLLYLSDLGAALVIIVVAAPFIITHTGSLWVTLGSHILCAARAYSRIIDQDEAPNSGRDSRRLLDEAARLETVDREKAIAAYEELVRLYPDTAAGREAVRNIQTLKQGA